MDTGLGGHFLSFSKKDKPLQGFRGCGAEPHTVLRKKKSVPFVVRIPEGRWGENKRIPHKNRKVMWKDGEKKVRDVRRQMSEN